MLLKLSANSAGNIHTITPYKTGRKFITKNLNEAERRHSIQN